jgi:hypothetical protein
LKIRFLVLLTLLAMIAGPARAVVIFVPIYVPPPTVPGATAADYRNIHTVAVISALGQKLTLRNYHFIGPKEHQQDITSWKLDEDVEAQLKKYLAGRFAFKDVAYDRAALAAIPNGKWDGMSSKFTGFMKTVSADGVDAFLVVRPDLGFEAPGVEGIGLENGGAFGDMTPVLWENYEIDIVDAHNGKVIGSAYSRVRLRDKTPASFVGLFVSSRLRVDDNSSLDAVQDRILRGDVFYLLHISMMETLRDLDMGIDLPPPGSRLFAPFPEGKDPYRSFKSAAIISGIGEQLDLEHIGGTILSRDSYAVP